MTGVTVSRWSIAYFWTAVVSFLLAQGLIASGVAYPRAGLLAPATLATVHLITIGWLTILMLGALHQFVPVIAQRPLTSQGMSAWSLALIVAGLAAMIAGFLQLEPATAAAAPARLPWLPVGGAVVVVGVLLAAVNIGLVFVRSRPLSLSARFAATGLAFLVLTVSMGVTMALVLTRPAFARFFETVPLLTHGLPLHLVAGVGGWFTLTAMGVAYKLLSMFTLAPEHRGAVGDWVYRLTAGGLVMVAVGGLVRAFAGSEAPQLSWLTWLGWGAALAGAVLYLWDMARLYRQRSRARLELNARFGAVALAALGVGVAALVIAGLLGRAAAGAPALSYLFLFGWLSGLGLTQLYKIVPFLTWLERFGPRLGTGPVPRVQDLVDERRARPWFVLYFAAVALGALSGFAGWSAAWQAASAVSGLATLLIARELWQARTYRTPA